MTITSSVRRQFYRSQSVDTEDLIRIPPTVIMSHNLPRRYRRGLIIKTKRRLNIWTVEEHERFLLGLEQFPKGPWKAIAAVVGTKTTRQTMTHSQKYREKIKRLSARAELLNEDECEASSEPDDVRSSPMQEGVASDRMDVDAEFEWVVGGLDGGAKWDSELDALFKELDILPTDSLMKL